MRVNRKRGVRLAKLCFMLAVACGIFYPATELTRLILRYSSTYGLVRPFWLELSVMWFGLIVAASIMFWFIGRANGKPR